MKERREDQQAPDLLICIFKLKSKGSKAPRPIGLMCGDLRRAVAATGKTRMSQGNIYRFIYRS